MDEMFTSADAMDCASRSFGARIPRSLHPQASQFTSWLALTVSALDSSVRTRHVGCINDGNHPTSCIALLDRLTISCQFGAFSACYRHDRQSLVSISEEVC